MNDISGNNKSGMFDYFREWPVTRPQSRTTLSSAIACYQKLLTLVANIWEAR
jgi:hypothetical protein